MSTNEEKVQLPPDVQEKMDKAIELLHLIPMEIRAIRNSSKSSEEFAKKLRENASLMQKIAKLQELELQNLIKMNLKHSGNIGLSPVVIHVQVKLLKINKQPKGWCWKMPWNKNKRSEMNGVFNIIELTPAVFPGRH